jgi:hypothetical protein
MDWKDITEDSREKYGLYMCSREWGERKKPVYERSGGLCERCKRNKIDAVHHLTYARLYAEPPEDLQGLCDLCHAFTHAKSDFDPTAVDEVTLEMVAFICDGKLTHFSGANGSKTTISFVDCTESVVARVVIEGATKTFGVSFPLCMKEAEQIRDRLNKFIALQKDK